MPLTMEAKLSSRRMIPAASAMDVNPQRESKERKEQKKKINNFFCGKRLVPFDTSEPVMPIATPMFAFLSAGLGKGEGMYKSDI